MTTSTASSSSVNKLPLNLSSPFKSSLLDSKSISNNVKLPVETEDGDDSVSMEDPEDLWHVENLEERSPTIGSKPSAWSPFPYSYLSKRGMTQSAEEEDEENLDSNEEEDSEDNWYNVDPEQLRRMHAKKPIEERTVNVSRNSYDNPICL
jgi:hypothetical protein